MDVKSREEYCTHLVKEALIYIDESQKSYEIKINELLSAHEEDIFRHAFIAGAVSVGVFLTDKSRGN